MGWKSNRCIVIAAVAARAWSRCTTRTTGIPRSNPLIGQITIKGVPDTATLTPGLLTGAIRGGLPVLPLG
jgi:hypothetical protein